MEEIIRRLRNRSASSLKSLKESMPIGGLKEADEDEKIEAPEEELDDIPVEDEEYDPTEPDFSDEDPSEDNQEENDGADIADEIDKAEEDEEEHLNPLDNQYAVKYTLGQEVAMSYANGTKSKLTGHIDGYDSEGFYRIKWSTGKTTNGLTDIALADLVDTVEENKCVCGSTHFVNENNQILCDNCGRIKKRDIAEYKDPLQLADKHRPKGKKLVRSEAHPISTIAKPDISESIRRAFKSKSIINEDTEEDIFSRLKKELSGEFWTRQNEIVSDIEALGYTVDDYNSEYFVVSTVDDEGDDHGILIPLGGTSRTMTLDFDRARKV